MSVIPSTLRDVADRLPSKDRTLRKLLHKAADEIECLATVQRIMAKLQPAVRSAHSVLCGIMGELAGGRPVDGERVFEVFTILNQAIGSPGAEAREPEKADP